MQSADSSLGLSWWLFYQMPGKLQGFKLSEPLGFGWTRLLACHCLRRVHLYTEAPLRASASGYSPMKYRAGSALLPMLSEIRATPKLPYCTRPPGLASSLAFTVL